MGVDERRHDAEVAEIQAAGRSTLGAIAAIVDAADPGPIDPNAFRARMRGVQGRETSGDLEGSLHQRVRCSEWSGVM
jgi:hypothetical protein